MVQCSLTTAFLSVDAVENDFLQTILIWNMSRTMTNYISLHFSPPFLTLSFSLTKEKTCLFQRSFTLFRRECELKRRDLLTYKGGGISLTRILGFLKRIGEVAKAVKDKVSDALSYISVAILFRWAADGGWFSHVSISLLRSPWQRA